MTVGQNFWQGITNDNSKGTLLTSFFPDPEKRKVALDRLADSVRYGVVLCGGQSKRFERDKASFEVEGKTMLQRVVNSVQPYCDEVLLVRSLKENPLPAIECQKKLTLLEDSAEGLGPIEGLRSAMTYGNLNFHGQVKKRISSNQSGSHPAVPEPSDCYPLYLVAACDYPFLPADWFLFLLSLLGSEEAVVPRVRQRWETLNALYHGSVLKRVEEMVEAGERKLQDFVCRLKVREVSVDEIRSIDPDCLSLRNINYQNDL